jgi:hypothetical protein
MSELSVVGGIMMLGHMFDVFAWGIVLSLVAMGLAFMAEGRGAHVIEAVRRAKSREEHIDFYATLHREEGDWQLLGSLSEIDRANADRAGLQSVSGRRH